MKKQRLIDANALKEIYEKWLSEVEEICYQNDDARSAIFSCICQLEEAPTVEAEPEEYGEWIDGISRGTPCVRCSECSWESYIKDRYCSYCGTKMKNPDYW